MHKLFLPIFLILASATRAQEPAQNKSALTSVSNPTSVAKAEAELKEMQKTDQLHRSGVIELERKHGENSPEVSEAWSKQNAIDAQNIRRLEEIITQHGWPGSRRLGGKAANAAFPILQHSDLSYQKRYLPLARDAAAKGDMPPSSLALLEDRIRLREGQKQICGSQVTKNAADEWEPLPLDDEANVDALRARIGLPPISDYLKGFADRSGGRVNPKWAKTPDKKPNSDPTAPRARGSP